jgi:hypothetical protein
VDAPIPDWPAHRELRREGMTLRTYVDSAGQTIDAVERTRGEVRAARLFIGMLVPSSDFYAAATGRRRFSA